MSLRICQPPSPADNPALMHTTVKEALHSEVPHDSISLAGWVRTRRDSKAFSFLELNDGSCLKGIQIVADAGIPGYDAIAEMTTGASVRVEGKLIASQGQGQKWEVQATSVALVGTAD
ncbi:MAG TPA: OB-fold nucleic acid binding domain-containing protein, partial [Verrucomicrobiales bacterium]|nr:OB-fold nucleic acid binding domain-containing protein [Verrucomicrobiales bacterium]